MQENTNKKLGVEEAIPSDSNGKPAEKIDSQRNVTAKAARPKKKRKLKAKRKKTSTKSEKKTLVRAPRLFPALTLKESLRIPAAIRENNGGHPWAPDQVAAAVGMSEKTTSFFYLAGSSVQYGLTTGTWKADRIELTALGRDIVYPRNAQAEYEKKLEAFFNIDIFKKVFEHYRGSNLPEMKYLGNTLERDFLIPPEQHEDFARIFRENCEYLNIQNGLVEGKKSKLLVDRLGTTASSPSVTLAEPEKDSDLVAFVIMPFVEHDESHEPGFFDEVLKSLITPAAREAGFIVKTANRHGSDVIQSTIINDLLAADLVVADLTEHNPNVLFELGVRMADDLPVCLIKASGTGQIFDVDNMLRVYTYSRNLWATTIEKDLPNLTDHIKGAWESRDSDSTYMKILKRGVPAIEAMAAGAR